MPAPLPVLALDIDGVLNIDTGAETANITIPRDEIAQSPFVQQPDGDDMTVTVRWDPDTIRWINSLTGQAELRWATTWERAARHFAATVGLPTNIVPIEHSKYKVRFSDVRNGNIAGWKYDGLEAELGDRPTIWIDDLAWSFATISTWLRSDAPLLVLVPRRTEGITLRHRERIEAFLNAHQPT